MQSQGPLAKESIRVRVSKDVTMEAEIGMMCSEDEGRGHEPRQAGSPQKLEKAITQIIAGNLQNGTQQPCSIVTLI